MIYHSEKQNWAGLSKIKACVYSPANPIFKCQMFSLPQNHAKYILHRVLCF